MTSLGVGIIPAGTDPKILTQINFKDHRTLRKPLIIVNATLFAVVAVIVTLRIYARLFLLKRLFTEDVLIILATVFTMVMLSASIAGTHFGLGLHAWNLHYATLLYDIEKIIQILWITFIFSAFATCFTKLSIIATYLRVIPHAAPRPALYVTGAVVILHALCGVFVTTFQCTPITAVWNFEISPRKCLPYTHFLYASSAIALAVDLVLCTLPLPFIWRLNIPKKERIVVCLLFIIGFAACIAVIIRLTTIHLLKYIDVSYLTVNGLICTVVETVTGIVCVSIPSLRPLVRKIRPGLLRSSSDVSALVRNNCCSGESKLINDKRDATLTVSGTEVVMTPVECRADV